MQGGEGKDLGGVAFDSGEGAVCLGILSEARRRGWQEGIGQKQGQNLVDVADSVLYVRGWGKGRRRPSRRVGGRRLVFFWGVEIPTKTITPKIVPPNCAPFR